MHFSVHAKRHTRSHNSDTSADTSVNICSQKWLLARTYLWITMQIYVTSVKEVPRRFEQMHLLLAVLKFWGDWQVHCHSLSGSWLPAFSTVKAEYYLSTRSITMNTAIPNSGNILLDPVLLQNGKVQPSLDNEGDTKWKWYCCLPGRSSIDGHCLGHHRRSI